MSVSARFERIVHAHQRGVWWFLRALGCDPSLADDLTQDVFLAVYRSGFEEINERATAAYLRTAARRAWADHWIRAKREPRGLEQLEAEEAESVFEIFRPDDLTGDAFLALERCLDELDGRSRAALDMIYRDGHSRAEVARAMELGENGAIALLQRAKTTLRDCVQRRLAQ